MDYLRSRSENNMMIPCANPKAQYVSYRDDINLAIQRVLDSGWYILGEELVRFEKKFEDLPKGWKSNSSIHQVFPNL